MATTLIVSGQSTDFTTDPNISLMQLIRDNWNVPAGSLPADCPNQHDIRFGTGWWTGHGYYQIHVKQGTIDSSVKTLGMQRFKYFDKHDIHIFAKGGRPQDGDRVSGKDRKWRMELELSRILAIKAATPITGVSFLRWSGPTEVANPEDHKQDIFHSLFTVELYYEKNTST